MLTFPVPAPPPPSEAEVRDQEAKAKSSLQYTLSTCFVLYLCTCDLLKGLRGSKADNVAAPFVVDYVRKLI